MSLWSLLVGGIAYGWAPFTNPAGGVLEWSEFLPRFAVIVGYLVVYLLQVGGIAFWLSTRTDAPLAAVGGAVMVTIVSSILSQIETLGGWRNGLPMYYARSWFDALAPQIDWTGMRHGVLWSVLYTVVLVGLAYRPLPAQGHPQLIVVDFRPRGAESDHDPTSSRRSGRQWPRQSWQVEQADGAGLERPDQLDRLRRRALHAWRRALA